MNIQEVLDLADQLKPNMMTRQVKIAFLQELDQKIYKEILLKDKLTRDEASADMLDIIFSSITFDPGVVLWCSDISDRICADIFMKRSDAIVSYLEKQTPVFQGFIDTFNEAVAE